MSYAPLYSHSLWNSTDGQTLWKMPPIRVEIPSSVQVPMLNKDTSDFKSYDWEVVLQVHIPEDPEFNEKRYTESFQTYDWDVVLQIKIPHHVMNKEMPKMKTPMEEFNWNHWIESKQDEFAVKQTDEFAGKQTDEIDWSQIEKTDCEYEYDCVDGIVEL